MKKTIKILALIMALLMAVACFSACGDDETATTDDDEKIEENDKKEDEEENPEEEVKKVAEGYLEGYAKEIASAEDFEKNVSEYIAKNSDAYNSVEEYVQKLNSDFEEGTSLGISSEDAERIVLLSYNLSKEHSTYKIDKVEVDEDKATVTVSAEVPDTDSVEDSEEYTDRIMTLLMEYLEENGMGIEVLMTDDQDAVNAVMVGFVNDKIDEIEELYVDVVTNAPKKTTEIILTVEKTEDEWLITEIEDEALKSEEPALGTEG